MTNTKPRTPKAKVPEATETPQVKAADTEAEEVVEEKTAVEDAPTLESTPSKVSLAGTPITTITRSVRSSGDSDKAYIVLDRAAGSKRIVLLKYPYSTPDTLKQAEDDAKAEILSTLQGSND